MRFRRFFTDGISIARIDVGFAPWAFFLDEQQVLQLVDTQLRQETRLGDRRETLGRAERMLAAAYLRASTSTKHLAQTQAWWVVGGAPVTIIEAPCGS